MFYLGSNCLHEDGMELSSSTMAAAHLSDSTLEAIQSAFRSCSSSSLYAAPIAAASVLLLLTIALLPWTWRWLLMSPGSNSSYKGPSRWPLVGSYLELIRNKERIYDWVTDYSRLYKTFEFSRGATRIIHTTDPPNVEYILKTNFANYPKGDEPRERQYELLGNGIFNSDGEIWKKHRKISSYEFSSRKLRDFSSKIFKKNAIKLANILDSAVESQQVVELQNLFMRLTLDSICELGFGLDLGALAPSLPEIPFATAFDKVTEATLSRSLTLFWRTRRALGLGFEKELQKGVRLLDAFTYDVIQKRKKLMEQANQNDDEISREDLLSRFMNVEGEGGYTDKDLRDSVLNFVIAGRDTTALALSWLVYLLCNNPNVEHKIYEEVRSVVGDPENHVLTLQDVCELLTFERVQELHYLHAAINETLRLYPSVPWDGKVAYKDDVLPDGKKVKAGDRILYGPYAMGRMEFLWGDDALKFKPERWFKDNKFQSESPFKFTAFQAGPRTCLGKDSAYLQMKITVAILIAFYQFNLVPTHKVHYRVTMVLQMANGLKVFVSRR